MKLETSIELQRTSRLAEALYKVIVDRDIQDELPNHHIRNSVAGLRGVDPQEDAEEEILTLCKDTQERLHPFLYLLRPEK